MPREIDKAQDWFDRHGGWAVLVGRVIPGVRTFISVPAGFADGLPIGVQLAARRWEDDTALHAAAIVEAACGGYEPPPVRSKA